MNAHDPPSTISGGDPAGTTLPRDDAATEQSTHEESGLFEPVPPRSLPPADPPPLRRSTTDEVLGGVCGGLGQATGVDPLWFRLGFIFLALSTGVGLLAYIALWVLIPEATEEATAQTPTHSGQRTAKAGAGAILFGIFLVVVGSALLVDVAFPWFDRVLWPTALIALGAGLLFLGAKR